MKRPYVITLVSCHDSNAIKTALTPAEAKLLRRVAASLKAAARHEHMPTMHVRAADATGRSGASTTQTDPRPRRRQKDPTNREE